MRNILATIVTFILSSIIWATLLYALDEEVQRIDANCTHYRVYNYDTHRCEDWSEHNMSLNPEWKEFYNFGEQEL
jgi:hypothetical protein